MAHRRENASQRKSQCLPVLHVNDFVRLLVVMLETMGIEALWPSRQRIRGSGLDLRGLGREGNR